MANKTNNLNKINMESENVQTARDKGVNSTDWLDIIFKIPIPPCLVPPNRLGMCATTEMTFCVSSNAWNWMERSVLPREKFQARKQLHQSSPYYRFHRHNFPSHTKDCKALDKWSEFLPNRLDVQMYVDKMKHRPNGKPGKQRIN